MHVLYTYMCDIDRPKRTINNIFTDRVRSTRREVIVSLCLSVHTSGGRGGTRPGPASWGVPHLGYPPIRPGWGVSQWGGTPPWVPLSDLAGGYPKGGYPTLDNRWSTWYAAVGMPLAFTQEDFHVHMSYFVCELSTFSNHSDHWEYHHTIKYYLLDTSSCGSVNSADGLHC